MTKIDYSKTEPASQSIDKFFRVFSRFEFALKEAGFLKDKDSAEANWTKFVSTLPKDYWEELDKIGLVKTLIQTPPKKQICSDGKLDWKNCQAVSSNDQLLGAMQRVRNNLFHGGKSGDPDSDRNDALIADVLFVLDDMLKQNDDLRSYFEGRY